MKDGPAPADRQGPLGRWLDTWRARLAPPRGRKLATGLAIGAAGGFLAQLAGVPLAWMLGPLFLCMAATLAGVPADVPLWMRTNFMFVIGLFLGESFEGLDPGLILRWPISMAGAVLYLPLATAFAFFYYRWIVREERMTALCSSIPGGLTAVVVVSGALGADERNVALAQSLRIAFVVCMAPAVAFGLLGYPPPPENLFEGQQLMSAADLALTVGASLALLWALRRTSIPALTMVCPLVASAGLRMAGLVEGVLPHALVEVGLLVMGASIGTRFAGVDPRRLLRFGVLTFGGTAILMAVAGLLAWAASLLTGIDLVVLLLAYAPGGVAEMSLIALAIDADAGFVAVHHLVRIICVMIAVPLLTVAARRSPAAGAEPSRGP